jgi:hypothetical protein
MKAVEIGEVRTNRLRAFHVQDHGENTVTPPSFDFIYVCGRANFSGRAPGQAVQSAQLSVYPVARIGGVERVREANLVSRFGLGKIALGWVLWLGEQGEQATCQPAFPGAEQVEMAVVGTSQEVPAARAIFGQMLHGVVVAIEYCNWVVFIHS